MISSRPIRILALAAVLAMLPVAASYAQDSQVEPQEPAEVELETEAEAEASEEEESPFSRSGGYVAFGGGKAIEFIDNSRGNYDDSIVIIIKAGYRGNRYFSVEAVGDVLLDFDDEGFRDNDADGYTVTVNAKLHLPLGRIEPFVAAGFGILRIEEGGRNKDRQDLALRGAAGFDLHLSRHLSLFGEAAYVKGIDDLYDWNYAAVGGGLMIRF